MNYFEERLFAASLESSYSVAPPRVKRHLAAEINHVILRSSPKDIVLELGCGYGRALFQIAPYVNYAVGVDINSESLLYAEKLKNNNANCEFFMMDACNLEFSDNEFDMVYCIQNGISAFNDNPESLLAEALRVTKIRGRVIFSSYSEKFWLPRLRWFMLQAKIGAFEEIDLQKSLNNNTIVTKTGLKMENMTTGGFLNLCNSMGVEGNITEIDNSLIFCEIIKI